MLYNLKHGTFYIRAFQQSQNRTPIEHFSSIVIRSSKINRENQIESNTTIRITSAEIKNSCKRQ